MSLAKTVVMVSPDRFGFNPQTAGSNSFQHDTGLPELKIRDQAIREFRGMVSQLEKERIRVLVLGSRIDSITPDAVFPNNWFSHHEGGKLVVYPMKAENRRLERQPHNLKSLLNDAGINHIKILDLSKDEEVGYFLEGTGSLVLERDNRVAFAAESPRTGRMMFNKWCREMGYEGILFHAYDGDSRPIYHTNVVMSIGQEFAVICLDAIASVKEKYTIEKRLNGLGKEIIAINNNQLSGFCGNIIQLKSADNRSKIVMSETAYKSFTPAQKNTLKKFGKLIPVSIPTIENIGGGSARCMIAEIY